MSTTATTPAGWYPDPADASAQRWWNGVSWSDHVRPVTDVAVVVPAARMLPSFDSLPAESSPYAKYAPMAPAASALASGRPVAQSPDTVWIWLLAFGPFISGIAIAIAQVLLLVVGAAFSTAGLDTQYLGPMGLVIGFIPVWVVAGLDIRALKQLGYRPPSILFMLLAPPLVYFAARGRMLRQVGARSRGPEIAFLLVFLLHIAAAAFGAITAASVVNSVPGNLNGGSPHRLIYAPRAILCSPGLSGVGASARLDAMGPSCARSRLRC